MKVKNAVEKKIVEKEIINLFEKYHDTLDQFIELQKPRPKRFEKITTESDWEERYEFFEWVREEVSQPFGRFVLDDRGLAYSADIFSFEKNHEVRDWYGMVWGDILDEVIWCAYEFDAPVKSNYLEFMGGQFEHFIKHHGDIKIEVNSQSHD